MVFIGLKYRFLVNGKEERGVDGIDSLRGVFFVGYENFCKIRI